MKEIISITDPEEIQNYIEEKEGVKLILRTNRQESRGKGHPPHYDTGTANHMLWCAYSASTLLSDDFEGGDFIFLDDEDNIIERVSKDEHYQKTLIYDSTHKHMVEPHHNGNRIVQLLFREIRQE